MKRLALILALATALGLPASQALAADPGVTATSHAAEPAHQDPGPHRGAEG